MSERLTRQSPISLLRILSVQIKPTLALVALHGDSLFVAIEGNGKNAFYLVQDVIKRARIFGGTDFFDGDSLRNKSNWR